VAIDVSRPDRSVLVSRAVALDFECGNGIAEIPFEAALAAKNQAAHSRVEAVRADRPYRHTELW
jgi:hypothetical protein